MQYRSRPQASLGQMDSGAKASRAPPLSEASRNHKTSPCRGSGASYRCISLEKPRLTSWSLRALAKPRSGTHKRHPQDLQGYLEAPLWLHEATSEDSRATLDPMVGGGAAILAELEASPTRSGLPSTPWSAAWRHQANSTPGLLCWRRIKPTAHQTLLDGGLDCK